MPCLSGHQGDIYLIFIVRKHTRLKSPLVACPHGHNVPPHTTATTTPAYEDFAARETQLPFRLHLLEGYGTIFHLFFLKSGDAHTAIFFFARHRCNQREMAGRIGQEI